MKLSPKAKAYKQIIERIQRRLNERGRPWKIMDREECPLCELFNNVYDYMDCPVNFCMDWKPPNCSETYLDIIGYPLDGDRRRCNTKSTDTWFRHALAFFEDLLEKEIGGRK